MWASRNTSLRAQPAGIVLRWFDRDASHTLEFPVELLEEDNSELILLASFRVADETPVTLVFRDYMVNGIVRSCRAEKDAFRITVSPDSGSERQFESTFFRDPGVLVVDEFLTEEEEAKILESLQEFKRWAPNKSGLLSLLCDLLSPVRLLQANLLFLTRSTKESLCISVPA